jgi:predicted RNA-binding Zn-ribbon protein involved in translation (DUF1610 family)
MIDLSQVTLDFPCPHCGHKFHKTIGWAESHSYVACPSCGRNIHFNASDLRNAFQIARDAITKFQRRIRDFGQ